MYLTAIIHRYTCTHNCRVTGTLKALVEVRPDQEIVLDLHDVGEGEKRSEGDKVGRATDLIDVQKRIRDMKERKNRRSVNISLSVMIYYAVRL